MKPDQPIYELWGKRSMRSSALASLLRYEGRRTRLFKRAEAAIMELYGEEGRVSKQFEGKRKKERKPGRPEFK